MVNKIHFNTEPSEQIPDLSLRSATSNLHQTQLNHDYADADILRLSTFIRSNPNPILVFNPDGTVMKANPVAERLLKRLRIEETDLLPEDHVQIVQACLAGKMREFCVEVNTQSHVFALTYHTLPAFKLVYCYAIDITDFRQAEEDLLQIVSSTIALAKQAVFRLQTFRKTLPKPARRKQPDPFSDVFVAMDGCVFVSNDRLGEWEVD